MGDTGILVSHAFSENVHATYDMQWKILTGKLEVNKGMLMENVVAQMLRASGQTLFFHYNSDQKNADNRMEIEFLLAKSKVSARHNIYPVEVKSANDYTTASMDKFRKRYADVVARPIVLHPKDARFDGDVLYLPLYMASLIPEIEVGQDVRQTSCSHAVGDGCRRPVRGRASSPTRASPSRETLTPCS